MLWCQAIAHFFQLLQMTATWRALTLCFAAISWPCSLVTFLRWTRSTLLATNTIGKASLQMRQTPAMNLTDAGPDRFLTLTPHFLEGTSCWRHQNLKINHSHSQAVLKIAKVFCRGSYFHSFLQSARKNECDLLTLRWIINTWLELRKQILNLPHETNDG